MTEWAEGQWKVACDRCGFWYKSDQLRLEWNNLRTCCGHGTNNCWEVRHPQEFVKGVKDRQAPPWVRPAPPDIELQPGDVTPEDL
jgi:hypothetical protein